jgi:bifunctional enzyme CysN/CysC
VNTKVSKKNFSQKMINLIISGPAGSGKKTLENKLSNQLKRVNAFRNHNISIAYENELLSLTTCESYIKSQIAIIVIDAAELNLQAYKIQLNLLSILKIKNIIILINKLDLVGYNSSVYDSIVNLKAHHSFQNFAVIPTSLQSLDNFIEQSNNTPWYKGLSLMKHLENLSLMPKVSPPFRGTLTTTTTNNANEYIELNSYQGTLNIDDYIRCSSSGHTAQITDIKDYSNNALNIKLDNQISISPEDIITSPQHPVEVTDQFEATIIWISKETGHIGRSYQLRLENQFRTASITSIKYSIDLENLAHKASKQLSLNDVSICNIAINQALAYEPYNDSKVLGKFTLLDTESKKTLGIGLINHNLRRSQNIHRQSLSITRDTRELLNGHKSLVIWFTGLSGSGKSTIANALEVELNKQGKHTYILDGDNVRHGLNKDLGFTDADRIENIRRVAEVAKLMMEAGLIVITSFISPFQREREMARSIIGNENFIEVYVSTSLKTCEKRDPKGLYKKARRGEIPNMTGIGSPYEVPTSPEFICDEKKSTIDNTQGLLHIIRL